MIRTNEMPSYRAKTLAHSRCMRASSPQERLIRNSADKREGSCQTSTDFPSCSTATVSLPSSLL